MRLLSVSVPCTTGAESSNQTRLRSLARGWAAVERAFGVLEQRTGLKEASAWTVRGETDGVRQDSGGGGLRCISSWRTRCPPWRCTYAQLCISSKRPVNDNGGERN